MNYNATQIKQKLGEQAILEIAKESGFQMREPRKIDGLGFFVEDSTCLSLPRNLSAFYPRPHSRKHGECATARIQLRMDLQGDSYEGIWMNYYRDNDQSFAHEVVKSIGPGSLAIGGA